MNVLLLITVSDVVCEDPTPPSGVTVVQPHNTTVSSVIVYQCQQSVFASQLSSVCVDNGTWSPDPTQVVCTMIPRILPTSTSPAGTVGEYEYHRTIEYWVYCITGASPFLRFLQMNMVG